MIDSHLRTVEQGSLQRSCSGIDHSRLGMSDGLIGVAPQLSHRIVLQESLVERRLYARCSGDHYAMDIRLVLQRQFRSGKHPWQAVGYLRPAASGEEHYVGSDV